MLTDKQKIHQLNRRIEDMIQTHEKQLKVYAYLKSKSIILKSIQNLERYKKKILQDEKRAKKTKVGNIDFIRGIQFGIGYTVTELKSRRKELTDNYFEYGTSEQDKIKNVEAEQKV